MYFAKRLLRVGAGYREPGQAVPEAATWPTLAALVSKGDLEWRPDPDQAGPEIDQAGPEIPAVLEFTPKISAEPELELEKPPLEASAPSPGPARKPLLKKLRKK